MRHARVLVALIALGLAGVAAAGPAAIRRFADRPVAWSEHDDENVPAPPKKNHLQGLELTVTLRDSLQNEADRILSVEGRVPAGDVNAVDEVPCSTWFCPRNHLHPMSVDEVAAGPNSAAPVLPLRVTKTKDEGAAVGFEVTDAAGHKFLIKFDPSDRLGLVTAAEAVGNRLFHAAGYNVPGAYVVDLSPEDFTIDPNATYVLFRVQHRKLDAARLSERLSLAARAPDGRLRAVAVPWIEGDVLGSQDMLGTREGDPNDRIQHQNRRSMRASWVLYAWLGVLDPGPINTIDTYVASGDRHFVQHYLIDFSCAFGSATNYAQGPQQDGEYLIEVGRTLRALFSLGFYQREFQSKAERDEYRTLDAEYPAIGYFPADFDPDNYRTNRKVPPHMRMTADDAYWGAKVVTSFSNAQIQGAVGTSQLDARTAAYVQHALESRRDIIGRRYLRALAAVENPAVSTDARHLCFDDLAIARGFARPDEVRYLVDVQNGVGAKVSSYEQPPTGARTCVPFDDAPVADGYRVISVRERLAGGAGHADTAVGKASRVHVMWRPAQRRYAVVGLERDQ
jgi:hypothetical protein